MILTFFYNSIISIFWFFQISSIYLYDWIVKSNLMIWLPSNRFFSLEILDFVRTVFDKLKQHLIHSIDFSNNILTLIIVLFIILVNILIHFLVVEQLIHTPVCLPPVLFFLGFVCPPNMHLAPHLLSNSSCLFSSEQTQH